MPRGTTLPAALASRLPHLRTLQTTAPLPPPVAPLPPVTSSTPSSSSTTLTSPLPSHLPPILPATSPTPLPTSIPSALSLLRSQSTSSTGIYILARLYSRTFLLHPRDILTLPTLKPVKTPGSTLKLTRILEVGSRDYAIRSPAANARELRKEMEYDARSLECIPEKVVRCDLTVLEHTRSPMESMLKRKPRGGNRKTIINKQGWTRLRVGDIFLGDGEGLEGGRVVLEKKA